MLKYIRKDLIDKDIKKENVLCWYQLFSLCARCIIFSSLWGRRFFMMWALRCMVIITVKRVADSVHGRRGLLRRAFSASLLLGLWDFCLCNM